MIFLGFCSDLERNSKAYYVISKLRKTGWANQGIIGESHVMCSSITWLTITITKLEQVPQLINYQVWYTAQCDNYTGQTTLSLITTINILKQ